MIARGHTPEQTLLILDLDGTFFDGRSKGGKAFAEDDLARTYQYISTMTGKPEDVIKRKKKELGSVNQTVDFYGKMTGGRFTLEDLYKEVHTQLRPEDYLVQDRRTIEMVKRVRQRGYRTVLASNNSIILMKKTMDALNLRQKDFDGSVCSQQLGVSKPNPLFFTTIAEQFGMPIENVISIGDNQYKDIEPAIKVGARGILVDGPDDLLEKISAFLQDHP